MPNSIQSVGGATQLALDCAGGLLRAVEKMHATIAARPVTWTPLANISRRAPGAGAHQTYALLKIIHGALSESIVRGFRSVAMLPSFAPAEDTGSINSAAILNGICGDHLEATQNPLAIRMSLRTLDGPIELTPQGIAVAYARVSPHIAVWVHGLCLSEQHWIRNSCDPMGARLQEDLGMTSAYVRYNAGRHISTNGRELSDQLERMIEAWPVPVESLTLIGHSMGGLVIRSAGWYGDHDGCVWRDKLRNVVCLGAPHHGSPLEKGGDLITRALQKSPYVDPLAFGQARSAGIKDLGHGNLIDEDWQHGDAGSARVDARTPVPLLAGVNYYFAAATVGRKENGIMGQVLGDLLVRTASATGAHADKRKHIAIPPENCHVFRNMNHFDLLGDPQVYERLVRWLTPQ